MDQGPFRVPRPADRSANNRPASARQPVEQTPVVEKRAPASRSTSSHHPAPKKSKKKPVLLAVIAVLVVAIISVALWIFASSSANKVSGIATDKYQAVFFTNGQVYFGKLQMFGDEYMKLTDVFYLQTKTLEETDSENPQKTSSDQNDVELIKLGNEIHGPLDEMIISKEQVLFYENLKQDGKVSSSIKQYKDSQN